MAPRRLGLLDLQKVVLWRRVAGAPLINFPYSVQSIFHPHFPITYLYLPLFPIKSPLPHAVAKLLLGWCCSPPLPTLTIILQQLYPPENFVVNMITTKKGDGRKQWEVRVRCCTGQQNQPQTN